MAEGPRNIPLSAEQRRALKKLAGTGDKQILGASIPWSRGRDEAIHSILDLMYARAPYTMLQRAMHIHLTVSELLPTMMGELKPLV